MFLRNKLRLAYNTLKSKSGVSLIFVLGIMMMLFAIGGAVISGASSSIDIGSSVMGAASANFGSNIRQRQYNEAVLLSESIHRTIRQSMYKTNEGSDFNTSLAYNLPLAIYESREAIEEMRADAITDIKALEGIVMELTIDFPGIADRINVNYSINLIFPLAVSNPSIITEGPRGAIVDIPTIGNPILVRPRVPITVTINAEIVIEVVVPLQGSGDRTLATQATYELRGAVWSDSGNIADDEIKPEIIGTLDYIEFGTWKLVSYEMIESHPVEP